MKMHTGNVKTVTSSATETCAAPANVPSVDHSCSNGFPAIKLLILPIIIMLLVQVYSLEMFLLFLNFSRTRGAIFIAILC